MIAMDSSEEISSDLMTRSRVAITDMEVTFYKRLMYYYYDKADMYIAQDTQDIINTYRRMNELF